jgi:hypothetical protein
MGLVATESESNSGGEGEEKEDLLSMYEPARSFSDWYILDREVSGWSLCVRSHSHVLRFC